MISVRSIPRLSRPASVPAIALALALALAIAFGFAFSAVSVGAAASVSAPGSPGTGVPLALAQNATTGTPNATDTSGPDYPEPGNASIAFPDQLGDDAVLRVANITLPRDGFVVIHGGVYREGIGIPQALAVSRPLDAGTHRNITINITGGVSGSPSNRSEVTGGTYVAKIYRDTDDDGRFEHFTGSGGDVDGPYALPDAGRYNASERPTEAVASVAEPGSRAARVRTGTLVRPSIEVDSPVVSPTGTEFTVDSVTLPEGGHVTVFDERYLPPENETVGAVIGTSTHLDNGTHRNVTVVMDGGVANGTTPNLRLADGQRVVVAPARETNNNTDHDYVASGGVEDVPFVENGSRVTAVARVAVGENASAADSTAVSTDAPADAPSLPTAGDRRSSENGNASTAGGSGEGAGGGGDGDGDVGLFRALNPSVLIGFGLGMIGIMYISTRLWRRRNTADGRIR